METNNCFIERNINIFVKKTTVDDKEYFNNKYDYCCPEDYLLFKFGSIETNNNIKIFSFVNNEYDITNINEPTNEEQEDNNNNEEEINSNDVLLINPSKTAIPSCNKNNIEIEGIFGNFEYYSTDVLFRKKCDNKYANSKYSKYFSCEATIGVRLFANYSSYGKPFTTSIGIDNYSVTIGTDSFLKNKYLGYGLNYGLNSGVQGSYEYMTVTCKKVCKEINLSIDGSISFEDCQINIIGDEPINSTKSSVSYFFLKTKLKNVCYFGPEESSQGNNVVAIYICSFIFDKIIIKINGTSLTLNLDDFKEYASEEFLNEVNFGNELGDAFCINNPISELGEKIKNYLSSNDFLYKIALKLVGKETIDEVENDYYTYALFNKYLEALKICTKKIEIMQYYKTFECSPYDGYKKVRDEKIKLII